MSALTVLLLSGGIDSSTLLHVLAKDGPVVCLAVAYGQRHAREILAANDIARHRDVELVVWQAPILQPNKPPVPDGHYADPSMRATVVPNRNMVLLALAGALAVDRKATAIAYAAHAGDHPVYPDCRPEFVAAMQEAMILGNYEPVALVAPFAKLSKADIVGLGATLEVPYELTWSCYRGEGLHCGTCGTCYERREAFQLAGVTDPTEYLLPADGCKE